MKGGDVYTEPGKRDTRTWREFGFLKSVTETVQGKHRAEEVAILFKKSNAKFGASFMDMIFESTDYLALKEAMGKHLASQEDLVFRRYLQISYSTERRGNGVGVTGWQSDHGSSATPIVGLNVRFWVYEISDPFQTSFARGKTTARVWRRLERNEDGTWRTGAQETCPTDGRDLDDLVEYTDHRFLTLSCIQVAIQNLAGKLGALLADDVKERGELLDRIAGDHVLLLAEGMQSLDPAPEVEYWYRRDASWTVNSGKANGRGPTAAHLPAGGGVALCDPKIAILDDERGLDPEADTFQKCKRCLKARGR